MYLWSGLRALFGAPKPKKVTARPAKKAALPPLERAALLKEALMAHRAGRAHIREVLERQLNELRAKVPKPGRGLEASEPALSLHLSDPP